MHNLPMCFSWIDRNKSDLNKYCTCVICLLKHLLIIYAWITCGIRCMGDFMETVLAILSIHVIIFVIFLKMSYWKWESSGSRDTTPLTFFKKRRGDTISSHAIICRITWHISITCNFKIKYYHFLRL